MFNDFGLILETAMESSVAMPATAAAEHARQVAAHRDEDFSAVIRTMEHWAGVA